MKSLWPWKGDTTSAASFEKTLSALAVKISKTSARNDNLRQRSRRLKVAWTLYTGFAYILAFLILTLVTGWRNWGPTEYTAIGGGPLVLYGGRRALSAYYNYRIATTQDYLDSLNKEKDATIDKLKAATKYNETLQIVEKYASKPSTPKQTDSGKKQQPKTSPGKPISRLPFQPPPTANIPRPASKGASTPQRPQSPQEIFLERPKSPINPRGPAVTEEFAPNAHAYAPQQPQSSFLGGTIDRLLNALVGEDENLAKNRWALLCTQCGLVNGLAPPGKKYEEVGRWKCMTCGAWNGQETETAKIMREVSEIKASAGDEKSETPSGKENEAVSEDGSDAENSSGPGADNAETPAKFTRSKTKGKKGKK